MAELNNRYYVDLNSSIYNFRHLFNKFIQDVANYSSQNVLLNPLIKDYYLTSTGNKNFYGWNLQSGNVDWDNIVSNSQSTKIHVIDDNTILYQRIENHVRSGEYYTYYLKIMSNDTDFKIRIRSDSSTILSIDDLVSDGSIEIDVSGNGNWQEVIHYFYVKNVPINPTDDIWIEIECLTGNSDIFISQQYVIPGLIQNFLPIETIDFLKNSFRYNVVTGRWEITNDGINYNSIASIEDVLKNGLCCVNSWFG